MNISIYVIIILTVTLADSAISKGNVTTETPQFQVKEDETELRVLSRRKRFLIFPDGSSFQIVFCTQNHGYLQIGNIVWFGTTAAMAWELPTDPGDFDMFRDQIKKFDGKRRSDVLYYVDEDDQYCAAVTPFADATKVLPCTGDRACGGCAKGGSWTAERRHTNTEYRKILINPAFAKRSVDAAAANVRNMLKATKEKMHKSHKNKISFKDLDTTSLERHRNERQKLYVKLEKFLLTLGWNGKECILKMLCVTGKGQAKQDSFVGEILRAVFTLPDLPTSVSELHKQYDDAHGANGDCAELYPNCEHISVV